MPRLTVDGRPVQTPAGRRLVLAIEDAGVRIGHRCGGNARCTTCRVTFTEGEPDVMTRAEYDKLVERGLLGQVRLSCQIVCDHDMALEPGMTLESEGWPDTGPAPAETVTPEPAWFTRAQLEREHGDRG